MNLIAELSIRFKKSEAEIQAFSLKAPNKYKVYLIPKRKVGKRVIAQPTSELKSFQRFVMEKKLNTLPIHNCAIAYIKNKSIKDNAEVHLLNSYLLNLDLEDFFNSITPRVFWKVWARQCLQTLDLHEKIIYERFLFWKPRKYSDKLILSIGAPSSPLISNFILYELDKFLDELCKEKNISYSRYADDLTFSTNLKNNLFHLPKIIEAKLLDLYEGAINLNKSKTTFSSKARNRHVTGLVLTNDGKVSIGRTKKRFIKHLIHQFILGNLEEKIISYLSGYLNFINDVEPSFIKSLELKYTEDIIHKIMVGSHD